MKNEAKLQKFHCKRWLVKFKKTWNLSRLKFEVRLKKDKSSCENISSYLSYYTLNISPSFTLISNKTKSNGGYFYRSFFNAFSSFNIYLILMCNLSSQSPYCSTRWQNWTLLWPEVSNPLLWALKNLAEPSGFLK